MSSMDLKGAEVEFQIPGGTAKGYLIGEGEGKKPGLLVIHEWWGLNDHIKDVARRFAEQGYVVLAPDLYGGATTKDAGEAGKLMQGLNKDQAIQILNGAVEFLKNQPSVIGGKIGVTGFCMGGTFSLLLPCYNRETAVSVPFYGDVPTEEEVKKLSAPVLFIGAENDPWITQDKMNWLKEEFQKLNKEGEVKVYAGAGHAFFNDTRPEAYDEQAARDAWATVNTFLAKHLR